jgi:DNA-directed RNA polymerase I subunit RPA43
MANQMLSVIGSIQPDPFSPEHVPKTAAVSPESEEADEVLNQLMIEPTGADDLGEDTDEENDTFRRLGKLADEAKRAELKARQETEAAAAAAKAAKKEKKKKDKKRPAEGSTTQERKAKKAKRKKVE